MKSQNFYDNLKIIALNKIIDESKSNETKKYYRTLKDNLYKQIEEEEMERKIFIELNDIDVFA